MDAHHLEYSYCRIYLWSGFYHSGGGVDDTMGLLSCRDPFRTLDVEGILDKESFQAAEGIAFNQ